MRIINIIKVKFSMKPVMIYSFPRSRSTATLQACKRNNKLNEPFDRTTLWAGKQWNNDAASKLFNTISNDKWNEMFNNLNSENTASKFFGHSLFHCLPARKWYNYVNENKTHDIFILERNLEDTFLSYILARHYNAWTKSNIELKPFSVSSEMFFRLEFHIDNHLRFFPKYGTKINFESLPESHFDKKTITLENQNSNSLYKYIINFQETVYNIKELIKYYQNDWNSIVNKI